MFEHVSLFRWNNNVFGPQYSGDCKCFVHPRHIFCDRHQGNTSIFYKKRYFLIKMLFLFYVFDISYMIISFYLFGFFRILK